LAQLKANSGRSLPSELARPLVFSLTDAMPSSADVKVIDALGDGWVMCQRQNVAGDIFYMNVNTHEVSTDPPAGGSPPAPASRVLTRPAKGASSYTASTASTTSKGLMTPSGSAVDQQPASAVIVEFGDWAVCEDKLGEFYFHWPTNQSYENPPVELLQLYKAHKQEDERMNQLRQALAQQRVRPQKQAYVAATVETAGFWIDEQITQAQSIVQPVTRQVSHALGSITVKPPAAAGAAAVRVVYQAPQSQAAYQAPQSQAAAYATQQPVKYIQSAAHAQQPIIQQVYQYAPHAYY